MTPEELQDATRRLQDSAKTIRQYASQLGREVPSLPASVSKSLRAAAEELDDASWDLRRAFGPELPEGVL